LQIAFVEAVREQRSERKTETAAQQPAEPQPESKIETPAAETPTASESEGKKKFVKSYGS